MRFSQPLSPTAGHVYEVRPRKDKRGVDLISDALSFGRLWYGTNQELLDCFRKTRRRRDRRQRFSRDCEQLANEL
jgi:hypothetical protein